MSAASPLVVTTRYQRRLVLSSLSMTRRVNHRHPWQNGGILQHFQQSRSYYYFPLSWQEFRERFQRWIESAEQRVVKTQLLSHSKLKRLTKRDKQLWSKENAELNPWFLHKRRSTFSIPLPMTGRKKPRAVEKFRARYQGWKTRRKEDYQGWKSRNKENFQGWKLRRKETLQNWKARQVLKTKHILVKEYSKPEWFDALGRPLTSRDSTGRFVNPWQSQSTNGVHYISTLLKWRYQRMLREWKQNGLWSGLVPKLTWSSDVPKLPHPSPALPTLHREDTSKIQLTWLGHATTYIQFNGLTILTDPMFSLRSGPYQWAPVGPVREKPVSHSIDELIQHSDNQKIDICCITHDHYDHLDKNSVLQLKESVQVWAVPLGLKEWLIDECGIESPSIVELQWWEQTQVIRNRNTGQVQVLDSQEKIEDWKQSPLTITCCPASHWGSRLMRDRNYRLWCSFALSSNNQNLFVCGDTGYPEFPLFRQIGDALGPFDLSVIPIGAYEPADLNKDSHVNPHEAVQVHKDIRSRKSVAIHYGSFRLSEEDLLDPPKELRRALQRENIDEREFCCLEHGASTVSTALEDVLPKEDTAVSI